MQNLILAAVILTVIIAIAYFFFGKNGNLLSENDAKRFARLVVSEIKLYNEWKVAKGLENNNLYQSLNDEIEQARTTYKKKFSEPQFQGCFDDALLEILADGNQAKLGTVANSKD